jgi:hypothetical protein
MSLHRTGVGARGVAPRHQTVRLGLHDLVALTALGFPARPVENCDLASGVLDYAEILELSGCFGDALASDRQHVGDELLCHGQRVRSQSVER